MQQLLRLCLIAFVVTSASSISWAQPAQQLQGTTPKGEGDFNAFAAQQAANNNMPGPRQRPAETIPVPTEGVSAAAQGLIAAPFPPHMNAEPKNAAEWKDLIERRAALTRAAVPAMLRTYSGDHFERSTSAANAPSGASRPPAAKAAAAV